MNYIAQSLVVPLVELTHSSCRYPVGDPCEDDFGFCGATKREGSAYCDKHHRLCYNRDRYHLDYGKSRIASAWTDSRAADSNIIVWRPRAARASDLTVPTVTQEELHRAHKERQARYVANVKQQAEANSKAQKEEEERRKTDAQKERERQILLVNISCAVSAFLHGAAEGIRGRPLRVKISSVQSTVAAHYKISVLDITSHRRQINLVRPRHIAMYLAKLMTPHTLPEIGRRFGGRDHSTVLHAVRKISALIEMDPLLRNQVDGIKRALSL